MLRATLRKAAMLTAVNLQLQGRLVSQANVSDDRKPLLHHYCIALLLMLICLFTPVQCPPPPRGLPHLVLLIHSPITHPIHAPSVQPHPPPSATIFSATPYLCEGSSWTPVVPVLKISKTIIMDTLSSIG